MKIKYKIKQVKPGIFAVVISDNYDRAMTFLRAQEYYESPSAKFRGKEFNIWEYMKWYSQEYGRGFTYGRDWSGFNIPFNVAIKCYDNLLQLVTPYDEVMWDILMDIERIIEKANNPKQKAYIIGSAATVGDTFKHELCHGLYYTNSDYKKAMDCMTNKLEHYSTFKSNLLEMGYTNKVINDEIQAYLCYGWDNPRFGKNVPTKVRAKYNQNYLQILSKFT